MIHALILLILLPFAAFAKGNETGHGGVSVVCRKLDERLTIRRAELFDLWEGSQAWPRGYGLNITKSKVPVEAQIQKAVQRLAQGNPQFAAQVELALHQVRRDQIVFRDGLLSPTDDVDPMSLPSAAEHCFLEQLGIYRDDDVEQKELKINGEIYETLESNTDRAAFFLHEAIFKVFRQSYAMYEFIDARTSRRTNLGASSRAARQLVAILFSERKLERADELAESPRLRCQSVNFDFVVFKDGRQQFLRLGIPVISRVLARDGWLRSSVPTLEGPAKINFETVNDFELLVWSTGGRLELPKERVRCLAN